LNALIFRSRWSSLGLRQRIEAGCLVVIAASFAVAGYVALGYGLWREGLSGAGLYPALAAFTGTLLTVAEAVRTFLAPHSLDPIIDAGDSSPGTDVPDYAVAGIDWKKLGLYFLGLIILVGAFERLGFFIATSIALMIILYLAERRSLLSSVVATTVLLAASYVIFKVLLGIQFPAPFFLQ
jgi:tripartite tricarboxylate transporter TctB family protein